MEQVDAILVEHDYMKSCYGMSVDPQVLAVDAGTRADGVEGEIRFVIRDRF